MLSLFRRLADRPSGRLVRRPIRYVGLAATAPLALGACAQLSDWVAPPETPAQLSTTALETTAEDTAFPNLSSVPDEPPAVASPERRDEIVEGLVADRANAEYSGELLRAGEPPPSAETGPLPEIFSISPEAGSDVPATPDAQSPAPAQADGGGGGGEAVASAPPPAAVEPVPEPEVAPPSEAALEPVPETAPETDRENDAGSAAVPPSPVAELVQPPEPSPEADAAPAAPEPAETAASPDEPGEGADSDAGEGDAEEEVEIAALPPEEDGDAGARAGARILFDEGAATLSPAAQSELATVAGRLLDSEEARIELIAYASDGDEGDDGASQARRLSLSRAIAVRRFLIDQGVPSSRMDVRALGDQAKDMPADRVDIVLAER